MNIEAVHNLGDVVYRMKDNKIIEDYIVGVNTHTNKDGTKESYQLDIGGGGYKVGEFHRTKEDVLKTLLKS